MPTIRRTIGHLTGIVIAIMYTMAGQAHFTDRFTPDLAAQVEEMTPRSHEAFWFLHLTYPQLKAIFGGFDLIAAALLWFSRTRRAGLRMAVMGFSGGAYGQWYTGGDLGQVCTLLSMSILGCILL